MDFHKTRKAKQYYTNLLEYADNLEPKYRNIDRQFNRFRKIFNDIIVNSSNYKDTYEGIDFGCGLAIPTILGKFHYIKITGMDILDNSRDHTICPKELTSFFTSIQEKLIKDNFSINIINTHIYPWNFDDNSKNFIIACWSLNKDFMYKKTKPLELTINERIKEFVRILKPDGIIYISGGGPELDRGQRFHYEYIIEYFKHNNNFKNIKMVKF